MGPCYILSTAERVLHKGENGDGEESRRSARVRAVMYSLDVGFVGLSLPENDDTSGPVSG